MPISQHVHIIAKERLLVNRFFAFGFRPFYWLEIRGWGLLAQIPHFSAMELKLVEASLKSALVDPLACPQCLRGFLGIHVSRFHISRYLADVVGDIPASQDALFEIKYSTHLVTARSVVSLITATP